MWLHCPISRPWWNPQRPSRSSRLIRKLYRRSRTWKCHEAGTYDGNNLLYSFLSRGHSDVKGAHPYLLQVILVCEVMIDYLKVSIDSLLVVARVLPHLDGAEYLIAGLSLWDTTSREYLIDLMHHVRDMLVGNSEGFSEEFFIVYIFKFIYLKYF